jgi:acetyl-CoA carboxylase biotin carboxyl carrier protein
MIEFPKRHNLDLDDEEPSLAELSGQARRLAEELPGPLRRIALRAGSMRVDVEWEASAPAAPVAVAPPVGAAAVSAPAAAAPPARDLHAVAPDGNATPNIISVTAPLVGTFYRAPSPQAEPFVRIGEVVSPGQTLAIVEAMKLMNNITAEHGGKVVAIHANNGDVVEFAQPLLDLEPVD